MEAGEQDRGLHLRTGHWQCVVNRPQCPSTDAQRRKVALAPAESRAHLAQWLHHAAHRAAPQRRVTSEDGLKRVRRQRTGQHPQRRTGVAGIELPRRRRETAQPAALDPDDPNAGFFAPLHAHAERGQAVKRALAVAPGRIVDELSCALGQRPQDGQPVRDGLVTGQPRRSGQAIRRFERSAEHGRRF